MGVDSKVNTPREAGCAGSPVGCQAIRRTAQSALKLARIKTKFILTRIAALVSFNGTGNFNLNIMLKI
jgi:hypothetical protein